MPALVMGQANRKSNMQDLEETDASPITDAHAHASCPFRTISAKKIKLDIFVSPLTKCAVDSSQLMLSLTWMLLMNTITPRLLVLTAACRGAGWCSDDHPSEALLCTLNQ